MIVKTTQEQLDTPIAELEGWGLRVRAANAIADLGYLRVCDLAGVDQQTIRSKVDGRKLPDSDLDDLAVALRKFLAGEPPMATDTVNLKAAVRDALDYARDTSGG